MWPGVVRRLATVDADDDMTKAASLAGGALGFKAVCTFVKVDLKEIATSLGFAGVSTREPPCSICCCTLDDWNQLMGLSVLEHGWTPFTLDLFEACTRACEIPLLLSPDDYSTIRGLLEPDSDGSFVTTIAERITTDCHWRISRSETRPLRVVLT